MNRQSLAATSSAALISPWLMASAMAQESNSMGRARRVIDPARFVVAGSLIPLAQSDAAAPVVSVSAEDSQKQGSRDVYDLLRSPPAVQRVRERGESAGPRSTSASGPAYPRVLHFQLQGLPTLLPVAAPLLFQRQMALVRCGR